MSEMHFPSEKKRKIAVTGLLEMQQRVFESERNSIPAFQNGSYFTKLILFSAFCMDQNKA